MIYAIPTYKSEPDYRVWSSLDTAALIPAFFLTRSLFRPSVRVVIIRRRDSAALFARPTGRKEEKKEKEEEGKT